MPHPASFKEKRREMKQSANNDSMSHRKSNAALPANTLDQAIDFEKKEKMGNTQQNQQTLQGAPSLDSKRLTNDMVLSATSIEHTDANFNISQTNDSKASPGMNVSKKISRNGSGLKQ